MQVQESTSSADGTYRAIGISAGGNQKDAGSGRDRL